MKIEYVFLVIIVSISAYLIQQVMKFGGIKAAMFGAPIESTLGEIILHKRGITRIKMKVHRLGGDNSERAIGLEVIKKNLGNYQVTPITLSVAEAKELSVLLDTITRNKVILNSDTATV
jgi:hypothetical protein